MEYNFTNGTADQQARWREASQHLLHLPPSKVPLIINVTFVDPSALINKGHTDFAITTWTVGSPESNMQVRNDAPDFGPLRETMEAEAAALGLEFNAAKFYLETSAHELGHALFAALPEEHRVKIAEMFGAKSASTEELQPAGARWQDQIAEGIAETFKEAFLPRRYRVFPNRTNRKIAYWQFPEFRKLFRMAVPEISTGKSRPGYDFDIFERGNSGLGGAWPDARGGLYNGSSLPGVANFSSSCSMQAGVVEVAGGHVFNLSWLMPRSFINDPCERETEATATLTMTFEAFVGAEVLARWKLFISASWYSETERPIIEEHPEYAGTTKTRTTGPEAEYFMWSVNISAPTSGELVNPPTLSGAGGVKGTLPPFTVLNSFTAPWPTEELKKLEIFSSLRYAFLGSTHANEETWINELRETIPDFHFHQSATIPGEGEEIEVPPPELTGAPGPSGARPRGRPVHGNQS